MLRPEDRALLQEQRDLRGNQRCGEVLPEGYEGVRGEAGWQADLLQAGRDLRPGCRRVGVGARREPDAGTHAVRAIAWCSSSPVSRSAARRIPLARRQIHPAAGRRWRVVLSRGQGVRRYLLRHEFQPGQRLKVLQRQVRLALLRLSELRRVRQTLRPRHRVSGGPLRDGVASQSARSSSTSRSSLIPKWWATSCNTTRRISRRRRSGSRPYSRSSGCAEDRDLVG